MPFLLVKLPFSAKPKVMQSCILSKSKNPVKSFGNTVAPHDVKCPDIFAGDNTSGGPTGLCSWRPPEVNELFTIPVHN